VNAVAGSGKTTTIVECARRIPTRAVFVAFSNAIQAELAARLEGTPVVVTGIHKAGLAQVRAHIGRSPRIDKWATASKIDRLMDRGRIDLARYCGPRPTPQAARGFGTLLREIAGKCKVSGLPLAPSDEEIAAVIAHFAIDLEGYHPADIAGEIRTVLRECANDLSAIDFDDMIWLPLALTLRPAESFPWVIVDECQDLSPAQRYIVASLVREGGRMLAVGDPRQAIFGFAGAGVDSFAKLREAFDAQEFPLSVCYRCAPEIVARAQAIVPTIEAAPGAAAGIVRDITADTFAAEVVPGDMVLCRLTAPLIAACYALISRGTPARVRGRDIGKGLRSLARDCAGGKKADFSGLTPAGIVAWQVREVEKITREVGADRAADRIDALDDRIACLLVIFGRADAHSWADLDDAIDALFGDGGSGVELMTAHRAKGLEADRVYILAPDRLGNTSRCKMAWQEEQEHNLAYVAITRARRDLAFVHEG